MTRLKQAFCALLMLMIGMESHASNTVPGYVIKANGDTIWGTIDYGGMRRATNDEKVTIIALDGSSIQLNAK